jgi:RND superfamily putative drug exporter
VFHTPSGKVAAQRATIITMLVKVTKLPMVASVTSPFCASNSPCPGAVQVSSTGSIAFATVHFTKQSFALTKSQIKAVEVVGETIRSKTLEVQFGGNAFGQLDAPSGSPGEIFGLIATAIVLFLAFGSLLALLLPLGVALFALGVALAATTLLSHGIAIAQFAPILGSLIGLGVGIDYALFIVTRSRQGLKRGLGVEESIVTAIDTSGRAVLFAGSTVCIALLGMLALRLSFLNGVAISATLTVAITMLASLTLLPALLGFQKHRVLSRRERRLLAANGPEPIVVEGGWWR